MNGVINLAVNRCLSVTFGKKSKNSNKDNIKCKTKTFNKSKNVSNSSKVKQRKATNEESMKSLENKDNEKNKTSIVHNKS